MTLFSETAQSTALLLEKPFLSVSCPCSEGSLLWGLKVWPEDQKHHTPGEKAD